VYDDPVTAVMAYVARKLAVFPVIPGQKDPEVPKGFRAASISQADVESWWSANANSNIGIATGDVSGIVVIDIDVGEGKRGAESLDALEREFGKLPTTWTAVTGGGGTHYYFRHPGPLSHIPISAGVVAPGIDVRGDGGYVVAPPSVHRTGKHYAWELGLSPDDVPLADLPVWLRSKLVQAPAEFMKPKEIPEVISEGGRSEALTSMAGSMRRRGMSMAAMEAALLAENETRCQPPMPIDEVRAIVRSVGRYAPAPVAAVSGAAASAGEGGVPADPPAEAAADKPAGKTRKDRRAKLDGPVLQGVLEEEARRWLRARNLGFNAIEELIDTETSQAAPLRLDQVILAFANNFRRSQQFVSRQYVDEIFQELIEETATRRRKEIIEEVLALRGNDDGELRRWLLAVTGKVEVVALAVMKHWLWQVKRAMADLPIEHHIMPILLGPQGSGKSTATRLMMVPLRELACVPATGDMLTDSRRTPALGHYYVGVWDEMEGADKGSIEATKRTITQNKSVYRPMRSNSSSTVRVTMQWVGTSNRSLASMIRDASGSRRFYEIETLPRCDWQTIAAIDYRALWGCIDHEAEAPLKPHAEALAKDQESQAHRDSVRSWLEAEDWSSFYDGDGVICPARTDIHLGIPTTEVQQRYFRFCDTMRERPLSGIGLGMRLKDEGWRRVRDAPNAHGERPWVYIPTKGYRS
jgi:hypothetical protein